MSRMLALCLGSVIAATPLLSHADVYQCTVNGKVTFSDMPCSNDAKPMELNVYMPPTELVEQANKQTQGMEQDLAASRRQHQIDRLHSDIATKRLKRDHELGALKEKKKLAANNLAGATWENSISAEMSAVALRYQSEIDALNTQIAELQESASPP